MTKSRKKVRKAVLPVAGLGTRFLPATKAIPKEMLPIVDMPSIQLIVEECVAARHRGDHLRHRARQVGDRGPLRSRGRARGAAREAGQDRGPRARAPADRDGALRVGAPGARRAGLGHAVLCAREAVGDEPFAVVLGDDLLDARGAGRAPADRRLREAGTGVIALKEVPAGQEHMYGIVDGERGGPAPAARSASWSRSRRPARRRRGWRSSAATCCRRRSSRSSPRPAGRGGEIQLTDGLATLCERHGLARPRGRGAALRRGDRAGYVLAMLYYALRRKDIADEVRAGASRACWPRQPRRQ